MADSTTGKNLLSADVEIKGSIKFQNELIIDGKVEGEITSTGVLTVGENAEIRGEIKTKSVTVLGKVHGNITVDERCELKGRAVLQGDLKAARLVIEDGATFVGKSEVTPIKGGDQAAEERASSRSPQAARPPPANRGPLWPTRTPRSSPRKSTLTVRIAASASSSLRTRNRPSAASAASTTASRSCSPRRRRASRSRRFSTSCRSSSPGRRFATSAASVAAIGSASALRRSPASARSAARTSTSRDFKISGPFGRSIQTQGEVIITSKGELTSAKVACGYAIIEGKLRGNLSCTGTVSVRMHGKILGSVEAHQLVIEKRANVEFVRPVKSAYRGNSRQSLRAHHVRGGRDDRKGGALEGVVYAKAINIERGGIFSGELFIGQQELTQPDLLAAQGGATGAFRRRDRSASVRRSRLRR